jgi:hypothetical protein
MKVRLVERKTGRERGWLEFNGPVMVVPSETIFNDFEDVTTVGAFCGFPALWPPGQIHFDG